MPLAAWQEEYPLELEACGDRGARQGEQQPLSFGSLRNAACQDPKRRLESTSHGRTMALGGRLGDYHCEIAKSPFRSQSRERRRARCGN